MKSDEIIDDFWRWFTEHENTFSQPLSDQAQWRELDDRLAALGIANWEIRSGGDEISEFIISSPKMRNYMACRRVLDRAPTLDRWQYFEEKPPKDWKRIFRWGGAGIEIDARRWLFRVLQYPDGLFEIILLGKVFEGGYQKEEHLKALDFALECELGERLLNEKIYAIDICESPTREDLGDALNFDALARLLRGRVH